MSHRASAMPAKYVALYQATLAQAAQAGAFIMNNVLATARQSLKERVSLARGFLERDHLELAVKLLERNAKSLCEHYPQALKEAFQQAAPAVVKDTGRPMDRMALLTTSVNFDQLELMDSVQVHERVALARSQQSVMLAADAALSELNTYMCTLLGMQAVQTERNPLRPDVYVRALQGLITDTQAPSLVQMNWLQHMSETLGNELSVLYSTLSRQLQAQGIKAAGYTVMRSYAATGGVSATSPKSETPASSSASAAGPDAVAKSPRGAHETVLTLDRLRRLLVGELDTSLPDAGVAMFAAQFAREFEAGGNDPAATDFQSTVPAALEALQEMQQVDRLVVRLDQRRLAGHAGDAGPATGQSPRAATREQLRRTATGLGQVLSLEVVSLMVDNIVRDARLLDPIKDAIKNLEPALLKLALVDPRFFSHKQHPARRLLDEIAQRSLAFEAPDSPGLTSFLLPLQSMLGSLAEVQIEDAGVFEQALQQLVQAWDERTQQKQQKQQNMALAVQALQQAEQRSLLAEIVSTEIRLKSAAAKADAGVLAFLCGPWAQVVAHAQLADAAGATDPGHYRELIVPLLWSSQPALTRTNIAKLTRLVPKLLAKLREGLNLIDYPTLKTSVFFELLMNLQQQAFRPQANASQPPKAPGLQPSLLLANDPWLAPEEAKASGFMELSDELTPLPEAAPVYLTPEVDTLQVEVVTDLPQMLTPDANLTVGAWVELKVKDAWVRTQLSWASPHGTLFLFTSAYGTTQSMSRRSRDKLIAAGTMRVVSSQPVVQGALDAVVQAAMLNSLDDGL